MADVGHAAFVFFAVQLSLGNFLELLPAVLGKFRSVERFPEHFGASDVEANVAREAFRRLFFELAPLWKERKNELALESHRVTC